MNSLKHDVNCRY